MSRADTSYRAGVTTCLQTTVDSAQRVTPANARFRERESPSTAQMQSQRRQVPRRRDQTGDLVSDSADSSLTRGSHRRTIATLLGEQEGGDKMRGWFLTRTSSTIILALAGALAT